MSRRNKHTYHKRNRPFSRHFSWKWWLGGLICLGIYIAVFYYFFVGPTGFLWRALYGDPNYPDGYEIQGIDMSHYQGEINWDKLRNAQIDDNPVRFILIKATEGSSITDANFLDNFYQAREHGFIRGAYHYWSNKSSAREQAKYFIENVPLERGDLPPILDVERCPKDVSIEDFQERILTWMHIVEDKYHAKPILYTYYKFKEKYLNDSRFDQYPYWIAHYYVDKMEYKGEWKFWQYTDNGRVPGISERVDYNLYNGSSYDLERLTIGSDNYFDDDE